MSQCISLFLACYLFPSLLEMHIFALSLRMLFLIKLQCILRQQSTGYTYKNLSQSTNERILKQTGYNKLAVPIPNSET